MFGLVSSIFLSTACLPVSATGFGEGFGQPGQMSIEEERKAPPAIEVEKRKIKKEEKEEKEDKKDKKTSYKSPLDPEDEDEWDIPAFLRKKGK